MTPDYQLAAIKATEILIKHEISAAPIDPLPILKRTPGVLVMTFEEVSNKSNIERKDVLNMFGCENQDAVTTLYINNEKVTYVVAYNKMLPSRIIDRALARELGHIVLGHDGTKPEAVRQEEAKCFAHHLLCPRPLIFLLMNTKVRLTVEAVGHITGFYDHCLSCIRKQPPVHVPAELNRKVRDLFTPYVINLFEYLKYAALRDGSALADFGNYLEEYEE